MMKKLFVVLGFLSLFAMGYSQSDMTWTFYNLGVKSNNDEDALYWFNKARETTIETWEDTLSDYYLISEVLSMKYYLCGEYDSAIEIDSQTLEKGIIVFGENSLICAGLYHSLALSYHSKFDDFVALKYEKKAHEIYESIEGETSENGVKCLNMIAMYENHLGDYLNAIKDQIKVVEIYQSINSDGEKYATYIGNLSKYYDDYGDYENAIRWGTEALIQTEKAVGKMHPKYCNVLNTLGITYEHMGEYQDAIRIGEEAITIQKQLTGELDPDYVMTPYIFVDYIVVGGDK